MNRRITDRELKALESAVDAGFDSAVRRIQDWIRLPTIAAEQGRPVYAGVDPYLNFIDRNSNDNIIPVSSAN